MNLFFYNTTYTTEEWKWQQIVEGLLLEYSNVLDLVKISTFCSTWKFDYQNFWIVFESLNIFMQIQIANEFQMISLILF